MDLMDKDLASIQEARDLAAAAYEAQKLWAKASQEQVDPVCAAMAEAGFQASERLGRMASEETGYGVPAHKKLKNEFGSRVVWESIRDLKTVGVIRQDPARRVYEIAWPMGVVAGLIPSTNPTSTVFAKALIAVKARNAIVVAPHPSAARCTLEAASVMAAGRRKSRRSARVDQLPAADLPARHAGIDGPQARALILATGGTRNGQSRPFGRQASLWRRPGQCSGLRGSQRRPGKSRALYRCLARPSTTPPSAPPNRPSLPISPSRASWSDLMQAQGALFRRLPSKLTFSASCSSIPDGGINTASVGKSPILWPAWRVSDPGRDAHPGDPLDQKPAKDEPLSREKLTTVLGWYEAEGWEAGCERSIELIKFGGRGHTQIIHATDEKVIMAFGLEKPVFRILVNTMGTLGAIGLTTGVMPS